MPVKGLLLVLEFLASENVLCSLELCFKGFFKGFSLRFFFLLFNKNMLTKWNFNMV